MSKVLEQLGLLPIISIFAVAAAVILVVGSKLEAWAETLGEATRLGRVFAGMILLAISTSLPEIATTVTASARGNVDMAVNNLLGGVIVQTMVLALADAVGSGAALTRSVPSFGLLIQGVGLITVLAVVAIFAGVEAQSKERLLPAYVGPAVVAAMYVLMQYVTMRSRKDPRWAPSSGEATDADEPTGSPNKDAVDEGGKEPRLLGVALRYVAGSLVVCAAGYVVVLSTERLASLTGAAQGFLGFTLVAFATSLPEVSTTFSAARRGHPVTAVSNIFGSNSFDVALLLLIALVASGPVFGNKPVTSVFAASVGILMTAIYLIGMLERRNRRFLRMGVDSIVVLLIGAGAMWLLHAFTQR